MTDTLRPTPQGSHTALIFWNEQEFRIEKTILHFFRSHKKVEQSYYKNKSYTSSKISWLCDYGYNWIKMGIGSSHMDRHVYVMKLEETRTGNVFE